MAYAQQRYKLSNTRWSIALNQSQLGQVRAHCKQSSVVNPRSQCNDNNVTCVLSLTPKGTSLTSWYALPAMRQRPVTSVQEDCRQIRKHTRARPCSVSVKSRSASYLSQRTHLYEWYVSGEFAMSNVLPRSTALPRRRAPSSVALGAVRRLSIMQTSRERGMVQIILRAAKQDAAKVGSYA